MIPLMRRRSLVTRTSIFRVLACLWLAAAAVSRVPAAVGAESPYRVAGVHRVVVFADVHGAYDELVSLLRAQGVIDAALRWSAGDTHLVSLGDLIDRGPGSRRVLELLMRLEGEARAAGGALHVVLGNHEVMNIAGDLRYVTAAEYAAFAGTEDDALRDAAWQRRLERQPGAVRGEFDAQFPPGYFAEREAFSPTGRYGAWLLAKPFMLVVNETAFTHGGLSPLVAQLGLEGVNRALHDELSDYLKAWQTLGAVLPEAPDDFLARPDALAAAGRAEQANALRALQEAPVFTTAGPTWFRGQALCHPFTEAANLESSLAKLGVARVVVGHTPTPTRRAISRFDRRVILLDAGMLGEVYGGTAAALIIEGGKLSVAYADRPGELSLPEPLPRAIGPRPAGLDDDALESWLAQAEIVGMEELPAGITKPRRITLRRDGVELHAIFKQLSTDFGATGSTQSLNEGDRFEYEIAAYRLDRLLGLDMIPVTVPRTVNGRPGAVQFWVEGAINARQMIEAGLKPEGWCPIEPQYNLMNVFDVLVNNTDRTQENLLITREWNAVLIDHSRAFTVRQKAPRLLYLEQLELPPMFAARLAALDRETLQRELGQWLHRRQIDALLKRRDALLREYGTSAAAEAASAR